MNKVASFSYIDVNGLINNVLHLQPTSALNNKLDQQGYSSMYFSNNLGTLNLVFLGYFVGIFLMMYFKRSARTNSHNSTRNKFLANYLKDLLMYGYIIQTIMQSYSNISICFCIALLFLKFGSYGEVIQSLYGIVFGIIMIGSPFFVIYLYRNWKEIHTEKHKKRLYKELYVGLNLERGPKVLLWPFYFMIRRLLLGIAVVFARDCLSGQIFLVAFNIVIAVILIGELDPFETNFKRRIEYFNEINTILIMYTILCFSPFVPSY